LLYNSNNNISAKSKMTILRLVIHRIVIQMLCTVAHNFVGRQCRQSKCRSILSADSVDR